jgi:hypothetical protein
MDDLFNQISELNQKVTDLQNQLSALVLNTVTNTTSTTSKVVNPTPVPRACVPTTTPWIRIISPNNGGDYSSGDMITVTWDSCNVNQLVGITLLKYPIPSSTQFFFGIVNSSIGSQTITIPNTIWGNYIFNISTAPESSPSAEDYSDNPITLNAPKTTTNTVPVVTTIPKDPLSDPKQTVKEFKWVNCVMKCFVDGVQQQWNQCQGVFEPAIPSDCKTQVSQVSQSGTPVSTTTTLTLDMQSNEIKNYQTILQSAGFFPKSVTPNGFYGPTTKASIIQFQKYNGISQSGNIGPNTRKALDILIANGGNLALARVGVNKSTTSSTSSTSNQKIGDGGEGSGHEAVFTDSVKNISVTSATIQGHYAGYFIDSGTNSIKFEYSKNSTLSSGVLTTPTVYSEYPADTIIKDITGLTYNTTYYFRFKVTPPSGSGFSNKYGAIKSFKTLPRDGVCGSANNKSYEQAPTQNLCLGGIPSFVTGTTQWNWSCSGTLGSNVKSYCAAKKIEDFDIPSSGNTSTYYTVPIGISKIESVEIWGAGGGGSGGSYNEAGGFPFYSTGKVGNGGGGGGSGEYKKLTNISVTPGQIFTMIIGNGGTGGDTYKESNNTSSGSGLVGGYSTIKINNVITKAEAGGGSTRRNGGFSYGTVAEQGGLGIGNSTNSRGGKGGNGGDIYRTSGGTGGIGGYSTSSYYLNGIDGAYGAGGGGGGGSYRSTTSNPSTGGHGGKGGNGRIIITYPFTPTSVIGSRNSNSANQ